MRIVNDRKITITFDPDDKRRAEIQAEDQLRLLDKTTFTRMEVRNLITEALLAGRNAGVRETLSQNDWYFGTREIKTEIPG